MDNDVNDRVGEQAAEPRRALQKALFRCWVQRTVRPLVPQYKNSHTEISQKRWPSASSSSRQMPFCPESTTLCDRSSNCAGIVLRAESGASGRVDYTYLKIRGCSAYLCSAVDARGQMVDFRLSSQRDAAELIFPLRSSRVGDGCPARLLSTGLKPPVGRPRASRQGSYNIVERITAERSGASARCSGSRISPTGEHDSIAAESP